MSSGKCTNKLKEQWQASNEPREKIQPAVKMFQDKFNENSRKPPIVRKRLRINEAKPLEVTDKIVPGSQINGMTLNNTHKVTEKEKWERLSQDA
jgi:hypothetical protein